jgi:hypothetical protein
VGFDLKFTIGYGIYIMGFMEWDLMGFNWVVVWIINVNQWIMIGKQWITAWCFEHVDELWFMVDITN